MTPKRESPLALAAPGGSGNNRLGSAIGPENNRPARQFQGAAIVRLPIFRDGVFIGNEFVPISSRLRAKIRQMALEGRR
jgi:hypothetical protein